MTLSGTLTNAGVIVGAAGATIVLKNGDIAGGTLSSAGAVAVKGNGGVLDGTGGALTNQATITVANGAGLSIQGTIANEGQIALSGKTAATRLIVGAAGASLDGGGSITLAANVFDTITGAAGTAILTNVDDTISGGGAIGNGKMALVNGAAGLIEQTGAGALTIDTRAMTIVNAGTIAATGPGGLTIASAVENDGVLDVDKGVMTLEGKVTGVGTAQIQGGTLYAGAAFAQNVTFGGATAELELADSRAYTGAISGFSKTGKTSLDLRDIGFVSPTEATFSGNSKGGVLTVTDGKNTATITLLGNYTQSTFVASSDGAGGVSLVDPTTQAPAAASPRAFAAAMASLSAATASASAIRAAATSERPLLLLAARGFSA
jgi:hypothetical protein